MAQVQTMISSFSNSIKKTKIRDMLLSSLSAGAGLASILAGVRGMLTAVMGYVLSAKKLRGLKNNMKKEQELEKEIIKRIIKSFDTKERKARDINKDFISIGRFKPNYSLSEMEHALEDCIKETKAQAIADFKENLLMKKTNHQLGCMLECYQSVIENRIGFEKEAKQLLEIASKLK